MEHFSLTGYDIEELVGFGATGEVWRAVEARSGDVVALKRLHGSFEPLAGEPGAGRSEAAETLRREAALLASVRHEHVVRLRSVVPTSAGLVLVLEFAAGGSLAALLAVRERLTPAEVVTIGAPLAQALAEVHGRGLIHGDITPANVLFTAAGKPLLADLGVSSLAAEHAAVRGHTSGFADPAASAGGSVTRASDVYGLAAVCYAALAGRSPHHDGEAVHRPLATEAPAAPAALVAAIEKAMVPDPRSRPDAAAFSRALFAACAPEAVRLAAGGPTVVPEPELTHRVLARPGAAGEPATAQPAARKPSAPKVATRKPSTGTPARGRWSGVGRPAVAAAAGVLLVGTAIVGGVMWASHGSGAVAIEPVDPLAAGAAAGADLAAVLPVSSPGVAAAASPRPVASAAPAAPAADWAAVVSALDARRDRAFIDLDPAALDAVYTASSPALVADRSSLAQLVAAGVHARGLSMRLLSVGGAAGSPVAGAAGGATVTLTVRDELSAYDLVGSSGSVQHVAGRSERSWAMVVSWVTGGWRIASVALLR